MQVIFLQLEGYSCLVILFSLHLVHGTQNCFSFNRIFGKRRDGFCQVKVALAHSRQTDLRRLGWDPRCAFTCCGYWNNELNLSKAQFPQLEKRVVEIRPYNVLRIMKMGLLPFLACVLNLSLQFLSTIHCMSTSLIISSHLNIL